MTDGKSGVQSFTRSVLAQPFLFGKCEQFDQSSTTIVLTFLTTNLASAALSQS